MRRRKAEGGRRKAVALRALPSALCALLLVPPATAQSAPEPEPGHDITGVESAPLGGAIAVPLPEKHRRKLKRYEIPELVGSRQAIGSQLINGALPKPLLDYSVRSGVIDQRLSFFEGGLVVVKMTGAGGTIRKKLIIPPDAIAEYLRFASVETLRRVSSNAMMPPAPDRRGMLRVYDADGSVVEKFFDPIGVLPQALHDQIAPLEDLLRALSEDRTVTNTVANYEPKVGDQLVGDDRKTWRVQRIMDEGNIVELRCLSQPTTIYVAKKDLYNYFIGSR
jgi:hypothetical protein